MASSNQHGFRLNSRHDKDLIEELERYSKDRGEKSDRIKDLLRKGLAYEKMMVQQGQTVHTPSAPVYPPQYMYPPPQPVPLMPYYPPTTPETQQPLAVPEPQPVAQELPAPAKPVAQSKDTPKEPAEVTFKTAPPEPVTPKVTRSAPPAPKKTEQEIDEEELLKRLQSNFDF